MAFREPERWYCIKVLLGKTLTKKAHEKSLTAKGKV
jgi:hypothetical protein